MVLPYDDIGHATDPMGNTPRPSPASLSQTASMDPFIACLVRNGEARAVMPVQRVTFASRPGGVATQGGRNVLRR